MKVKMVHYKQLVNTGNFSHKEFGLDIELEEGEKAQDAFAHAQKLIRRQFDAPSENEREIAERVVIWDEEKDDIPF